MPYCLPFACQPAAVAPSSLIQLETADVRSMTLPEVIWLVSWPPPHCWKMSGGLPPARAAGTFVLNCSFWIGSTVNFTLGCAAVESAAACAQSDVTGSVVPLCHQVMF